MRNLRLFLRYARLNLMSAARIPGQLSGRRVGHATEQQYLCIFLVGCLWLCGESIGGYSFDDVMFIWAASSTAYGLAHVFFDGECAAFRARLCKANWISFCSSPSRPF